MRELKPGQIISTERLNKMQRQAYNPVATGGAASRAASGLSQPRIDVSKTPFVRGGATKAIFLFRLYEVFENHVTAYAYNAVTDETSATLQNIALPPRLQKQVYELQTYSYIHFTDPTTYITYNVDYTYINPTRRSADFGYLTIEEAVTPHYLQGEFFEVVQLSTNVFVSTERLGYMALFPGRDWGKA